MISPNPVQAFFDEKRRSLAARALMGYPRVDDDERAGVEVWARLLHVLAAPLLIRHPFMPLTLELAPLLGPRIAYLISVGDYELGDLELLERHVAVGDRVLEIGGGAGLTAAMSALRSEQPVVVVEPDTRLFPLIRRQVELNGGAVELVHAAVLGEPTAATLDFYLDEEIWLSSMLAQVPVRGERARTRVEVPALALGEVLLRHRPSVLMVDIEGAERELFGPPLPHQPERILVEIHTPILGETAAASVVQRLIDQGYRFVDQRDWTYVFARAS